MIQSTTKSKKHQRVDEEEFYNVDNHSAKRHLKIAGKWFNFLWFFAKFYLLPWSGPRCGFMEKIWTSLRNEKIMPAAKAPSPVKKIMILLEIMSFESDDIKNFYDGNKLGNL